MRNEIIEILEKYGVEFSRKSNTQRLISVLKNSSKVYWTSISSSQKLSEGFIREL